MPMSTLYVTVSTADGAIPIPNASVIITDALGYVAHTLNTDQNGMTPTISLFAPNKAFSLTPYSNGPAYSMYQISVSHPGYTTQIIRGVQMFEGVGSVLPVNLMPHTAYSDSFNIVEIPPPSAAGNDRY